MHLFHPGISTLATETHQFNLEGNVPVPQKMLHDVA